MLNKKASSRIQPYEIRFLLILITLRCIFITTFLFIYLQAQGNLIFHHGGDEQGYFAIAYFLATGEMRIPLDRIPYLIGFPALLTPLILLFNAKSWLDILFPFIMFDSYIIGSLSIVLVYLVSKRIGNPHIARCSSLLFSFYPFVTLLNTWLTSIYLPQFLGLKLNSDSMGVFLMLGAVFLFLSATKRVHYVALGLTSGLAFLVRAPNFLLFPLFLTFMLFRKRFSESIIFSAAFVAPFIPQSLYNAIVFKDPLTVGYLTAVPHLQFFELIYIFQYTAKPAILLGVLLLVGISLTAFFLNLEKLSRFNWSFLLSWMMLYLIFFSFYYFTIFDVYRFFMPLYPPFFILLAGLLIRLFSRLKLISTVVPPTG